MESAYFTSEEILAKAHEMGLELAERKLKYYVTLGILPRPLRNPPDREAKRDGRVAFFPPETVERLKKVKELQDSGFTLPQIKRYFERSIDPSLEEFLEGGKQIARDKISPEALLKILLSADMKEAARSFHRSVSHDGGEEAFQGAALNYYFEVLASLLGEEKARKYVHEFILDASPEEREKKMAPLRKWKDYIVRKKTAGGPFLSSSLDVLHDQLLEGNYREQDIMEKLRELAEKVNVMQIKYRDRSKIFSDAFELSRYMRQIFWVYLKALLELENFMKDKKKDHLKRARLLYCKADEMLNSVEDLIGIVKNMVQLYEDIESI